MAGIRVTTGGMGGGKFPSRVKGTAFGLQVNTFGLKRLREGITGAAMAEIAIKALEPAKEEAFEEWPKPPSEPEEEYQRTGASSESIRIEVIEVGSTTARVALTVGGEQLINDPRNESHKDYAPIVEYLGTPYVRPGIITHALFANMDRITQELHTGVAQLIEGLTR